MKPVKILLLIAAVVFSKPTFAQSPKAIEADLLKSFKRIGYWDQKRNDAGGDDSLENANDAFGKKLKNYTENYAFTIKEPFTSLKKERLDIFTSADGLFRIYSWDTGGGGTMREFANVIQYKTGDKTNAVLLTGTNDIYIPFYRNLYTFKTGNKTYYLGIYGAIYSSRYAGTGIKIFAIENDKLNQNVKLIKTQSGINSKIFYDYDFGSIAYVPYGKRPNITFDATTKTISIPLVAADGKVTSKFITYKFTGQYFEKVKS
ncbi:MAG: hypothetical protein V4456_14780 [Bacteroidota bacterium]